MIFVTVGTNEARFDRLLEAIDSLDVDEPIVAQHGASDVRPRNAESLDFLPFDELVAQVRRARVVVCHAGVGSVMVALANGKRPVVMPRLHAHGEAVDDHQLHFARRLADAGLVALVETPTELQDAISSAVGELADRAKAASTLAPELRQLLERRIAA